MEECEICYEEMKNKVTLICKHCLCNECYQRISTTCPFCREPIKEKIIKEEIEEAMDTDPDYWLEYDNREWVTYSRFMRNGNEIIRTFRRSEIPSGWRNDDMTTIVKRRRQRKRRNRINN